MADGRAQGKILSERRIKNLIGSASLFKSMTDSLTRIPTFHATSRVSLKQIEQNTLTKWIGLQPNERQNTSNAHAFTVAPYTSPLSFAIGVLKIKDRLISPLYLSPEAIIDRYNFSDFFDVEQLYRTGFRINKEKELVIIDTKAIETQRNVLGDVAKQFTMALFTGKELSSVSLPIKIMEPASELTAYSRLLSNIKMLELASKAAAPIDKFKYVISYACSSLYYSINYYKPMNAYLGETAQGYFADGSEFFSEKINHNPPMCAFYITNEELNFKLSFKMEGGFDMSSNEIKTFFKGIVHLNLAGQNIYFTLPNMWARGILYGKNITGFEGYFYFHYPQAQIKAFVRVGNSSRADALEGAILESNESVCTDRGKFASNLFSNPKQKLASIDKLICPIIGGFTEHLTIDGEELWNTNQKIYRLNFSEDALPSDWRFREDLLWMLYGDLDQAQDWKLKLEATQREFRKKREAIAKARNPRSTK